MMFKKSKMFCMIFTVLLGIIPLITTGSSVYASEKNAISEKETTQLSDYEISLVNNYVNYDIYSESFILNDDVKSVLNSTKLDTVQKIIAETNKQIQLAKKDLTANVIIETPQGTEIPIEKIQVRAYGKNDIAFYWNYARIWLDKGTVRNIGNGLTLGGIWIPHPIVKAVTASLGVVVSATPHGIWFDYNYFNGVLTGNFGFQ